MRKGFTVHHNGPPARCIGQPHTRCIAFWAGVRAFHTNPEPIGQGWSDIAYSFGVCPHGHRFVGRGWDKRQFANGKDLVGPNNGGDEFWYTVLVFVGGGGTTGYPEEKPTPAQVAAVRGLINEGRNSGRCALEVKPHSDWKPKPCPGPTFFALCRSWDGRKFTIPAPVPTPPPSKEDDVPYYTVYKGPSKPVRVFVDGSLIGFPNTTELTEFLAPYKAQGYEAKEISFNEPDEWDRYMGGGVLRLEETNELLGGDRLIMTSAAGTDAASGEGGLNSRLTAIEESLAHITEMLHDTPPVDPPTDGG